MPISFRVDPARHMVRTTFDGLVTFAELISYVTSLAGDEVLDLAQLIDGRSATLELTDDQTRELARLMESLRAQFGVAPVAFIPGDAASRTVAERYAHFGAGLNPYYRVFHDLPLAEGWIERTRG